MAQTLTKLLFSLVKSGCLTCLVLNYVGDLVLCTDSSMEPAIRNGDIILVEYMASPKRYDKGDIIITKSPSNPFFYTCKRIIALSGDKLYRENSLQYVPTGRVWLEGDNPNSRDSQTYGPVPQGLLTGRAVCILWPLSHISRLFKTECTALHECIDNMFAPCARDEFLHWESYDNMITYDYARNSGSFKKSKKTRKVRLLL